MLTGTFVTARGLRADRLRAERRRRIHVLDLRRGDHRAVRLVVRRRAVRAVARRGAPEAAEVAGAGRSRTSSCGSSARFLVGAMRVRWITIAVTLACFVAAFLALPYVPRQFFPASDRPELVVDLTLPQNASIYASDTAAGQARCHAQGRSRTSSAGAPMSGAARSASTCRSTSSCANDFFSQAVVVAKDVAARERLQAKLEKAMAEQMPSVVAPRVAARARAAGRLAGAIPGERPRSCRRCGRSRSSSAEVLGENPNLERSTSTGWSRPARFASRIDQDQARLLGLSSQALAEMLNTVMAGTPITQVRDDIYLINVIARAHRRAAHLAVDAARAAAAAARTAAPCR